MFLSGIVVTNLSQYIDFGVTTTLFMNKIVVSRILIRVASACDDFAAICSHATMLEEEIRFRCFDSDAENILLSCLKESWNQIESPAIINLIESV